MSAANDVLAETLDALRIRGSVYFEADFHAPWGMSIPSKDVAAFHVVVRGECWLRMQDAELRRLASGDIVMLAQGTAHELVHSPRGKARPAAEAIAELSNPATGDAGATTRLVCGHFEYDRRALHPFFFSLPAVIHVAAEGGAHSEWLAMAARLASVESSGGERGAAAVVDRLAEALLMHTLRLFLDSEGKPEGFVAAAEDPQLGRALAAMHDEPARAWSVSELASIASLSRSAFSARFKELVSQTPMRYLAQWRMGRAQSLLRTTELTIAEIAERVGYQSEFAFAKAFKRVYGESPGIVRRSA